MDAVEECVHKVGEMSLADLDLALQVLERGMIHVMIEQHLREHEGVSPLRAVIDTPH